MASSAVLRRPSSPVETKSSPFLQAPTCLPTAPVAELRSKKDDEDRDVKDHKNLIQRRRRGEAHIIKRCHQMFLDNDCHIYLVISHNDTDQKVIYNTEPGEGWPYTYERLKNWWPRPELNTPTQPGFLLKKALKTIGMTRGDGEEDCMATSTILPSTPPPPMFPNNEPLGGARSRNPATTSRPAAPFLATEDYTTDPTLGVVASNQWDDALSTDSECAASLGADHVASGASASVESSGSTAPSDEKRDEQASHLASSATTSTELIMPGRQRKAPMSFYVDIPCKRVCKGTSAVPRTPTGSKSHTFPSMAAPIPSEKRPQLLQGVQPLPLDLNMDSGPHGSNFTHFRTPSPPASPQDVQEGHFVDLLESPSRPESMSSSSGDQRRRRNRLGRYIRQ